MPILDILKECAINVYKNTHDLIGTVEGQEKFGIGAGGDVSTKIDLLAEKSVFEILKKNSFNPDVVEKNAGL